MQRDFIQTLEIEAECWQNSEVRSWQLEAAVVHQYISEVLNGKQSVLPLMTFKS